RRGARPPSRLPPGTPGAGSRRIDRGLRALHGGIGLVAIGARLLLGLAARELAGGERVLPHELELRAGGAGLGGDELRLGLVDRRLLRRDLAAEAIDSRLLGR